MIKITDISGAEKFLNPDLIEKIELVPDTLLVLVNGHHYIVRDTPAAILSRIVDFRRQIGCPSLRTAMVVEDKKENYDGAKAVSSSAVDADKGAA